MFLLASLDEYVTDWFVQHVIISHKSHAGSKFLPSLVTI